MLLDKVLLLGATLSLSLAFSEVDLYDNRLVPDRPINVVVEKILDQSDSLQVFWDEPGPNVTMYRVSWTKKDDTNVIDTVETDETDYTVTSLEANTIYRVCVAAKADEDYGTEECEAGRTDEDKPGPPRNLRATNKGTDFFKLAWDEPETPNGEILEYKLTWTGGTITDEVESSGTGFTITTLDVCNSYTISVAASTSKGFGDSITIEEPLEPAKPGAPTNVLVEKVEDESQQLRVTWTAPGALGPLCPVTGHSVRWKLASGGGDLSSTETTNSPVTITGLKPYTQYTACVKAKTDGGYGEEVCENGTTDQDVPGAPSNVQVTKSSVDSLDLTWEEPVTTNGVLRDYKITWSDGTISGENQTADKQFTISGLDPCTEYDISVSASTIKGFGDPASVQNATVPGKPSNIQADAVENESNSLSVTWTAPGAPGLPCPVTGYNVSWTLASTGGFISSTETIAPSHVIRDLLPYTKYTVRVAAKTEAGYGPEHSVDGTTDEDVPGIPSNVLVAKSHTDSLDLTWEEPVTPNGVLKDYKITWSDGTISGEAQTANKQFTIPGLDPCTEYDISVYASTIKGFGDPASFQDATDLTVPGRPSDIQAVAVVNVSDSLSVNWTAPGAPGHLCPVTGHKVNWTLTSTGVEISSIETTDPFHDISGLQPYTKYTVCVTSKTEAGYGPVDCVDETTDQDVPGIPSNVLVAKSHTDSLDLTWEKPVAPNGVLGDYKITWSDGIISDEALTANKQFTIPGLDPCTEYDISVYASTIKGFGDPASFQNATDLTVPGRPSDIKAVAVVNVSNSLSVTWTAPGAPGHLCPVTGHKVNWTLTSTGVEISSIETTDPFHDISGLQPYTKYTVCVTSKTEAGYGPVDCVDETTDQDVPGSPTNVFVTSLADSLDLTWEEPVNPNGVLLEYKVTWNDGTITNTSQTSEKRFTINGLVPCTEYDISVSASTIKGFGDPSSVRNETELIVPGSPSDVQAERMENVSDSLSVSWTASKPPGPLCPVTSYRVSWSLTSSGQELNSTHAAEDSDFTISGLDPYTEYTVCVEAMSNVGYGSKECNNGTTDEDVPGSPANVFVTSLADSLDLTWEEPVNPNGVLLEYKVTWSDGTITNTSQTSEKQFTINGLVPCTEYDISVSASTIKGFGDPSSVRNETDLIVPGSPSDVQAERMENVSDSLNVSWTASKPPGPLCPVTSYRVSWSLTSNGQELNSTHAAEDSDFTISGLDPYTEYTVCVEAMSNVGYGSKECNNGTTDEDVPGAPNIISAAGTSPSAILVSWDPPETPNGIITNYTISWDCNQHASLGTYEGGNTSYSITNLPQCSTCTVFVMAATVKGYGNDSDLATGTSNEGPPPAPLEVSCSNGYSPSDSILVTWKSPVTFCEVDRYNATCIGDILWSDGEDKQTSVSSSLSTNFDKLTPWTSYNVCVVGILPIGGVGKESCCTITTDESAPGPPTIIAAKTVSTSSISVSWDTPIEANGVIDSFRLKWDNTELLVSNSTARQKEISGLSPNTQYNISLEAHNKAGYGKAARAAAMTAKRTNTGAIVGGVIGGLCLVAVGIAAFVFRDKFKSIVSRGETHRKSSEIKLKKNTCSDNIEKEHLWEYIADLQEDTHRGLEEEFSQLQARCKDHPTDAATAPFNKRKNRFINILPYDHSRVKLSEINGIAGSDYINANYIKDHRGQSNFIATQGPKENTIEDFWRMVWEQKVYTIVMLTNLTEKGKRKCEKYWPDTNDQPLEWDNACVTLQAEERDRLYVTRLLEFSMGHRKRIMKQFHYLAWPDFGVPTSEEHLLNFIADVRDATASSSGPIIVHCSAGVGRTGTFIGLWNLMDNVNENPGASSINVNEYVMAMRRNRPIMVQSQEQYLYLYKCIATYIDNPGKWGGNSETTNDDAVYENFGYEPPIYENL